MNEFQDRGLSFNMRHVTYFNVIKKTETYTDGLLGMCSVLYMDSFHLTHTEQPSPISQMRRAQVTKLGSVKGDVSSQAAWLRA